MPYPQSGVFALGAPENAYLELDLAPGVPPETLVTTLANLSDVLSTGSGVTAVMGFRPSLWRALHPDATPDDAADWTEDLVGLDGYSMPATPHDAWFWIAGPDRATVFDNTLAVTRAVAGIATVATETLGWHYRESRDLTGFIDGTENPGLLDAVREATVPAGSPGAGASVLLYQIWQHDVTAWEAIGTRRQELAIGRTKADSIELDDAEKPESSHVARTVIEVDGEELKIFRRNVAYGDVSEHGTLFIGFAADQWRLAEMLRRMAGVDGIRDELTRFTTALTGAYYVIPATDLLAGYVEEDDD